jgi:hypothetical protein
MAWRKREQIVSLLRVQIASMMFWQTTNRVSSGCKFSPPALFDEVLDCVKKRTSSRTALSTSWSGKSEGGKGEGKQLLSFVIEISAVHRNRRFRFENLFASAGWAGIE